MRTVHALLAGRNAPRRTLKRGLGARFVLFARPSHTGKSKQRRKCTGASLLVSGVLFALAMVAALTSPASAATLTLRPSGAGDETTLSIDGSTPAATNWQSVAEVVADDGLTNVWTFNTAYLSDLYALADATGYSGTIDSVTVYIRCAPDKNGLQASARTRIKTNSVAYDGTAATLPLAGIYADYSTNYATNPQSGQTWTWTEVNALQAGVGLRSAWPTPVKASYCTKVWVVVSYTPPTLTVSGASIASGVALAGATEVGMEKLVLSTDVGTITWTDVRVDLTGTAADSDISSVEIWRDDGDGIWEGSTQDTEIGSGTFSSGTVSIDINDQTITTISSQTFYIVYDISPEADPTATAGAKLVNSTYITVNSPASVSNTNFPLSSGDLTLPVELVSFTATDSAGVVVLRWIVESEVNNAWFRLLKSDSRNGEYTPIAQIPGRGTTPFPGEYSYIDRNITPGQEYWYKLVDVSYDGETTEHSPVQALIAAEEAPQHCRMQQNYPNPFNPTTVIRYQLPQQDYVSLTIYNTQGKLVRTLLEGKQEPGYKSVGWDGRDKAGDYVASGVYLYVLKIDQQLVETKKMALIR